MPIWVPFMSGMGDVQECCMPYTSSIVPYHTTRSIVPYGASANHRRRVRGRFRSRSGLSPLLRCRGTWSERMEPIVIGRLGMAGQGGG